MRSIYRKAVLILALTPTMVAYTNCSGGSFSTIEYDASDFASQIGGEDLPDLGNGGTGSGTLPSTTTTMRPATTTTMPAVTTTTVRAGTTTTMPQVVTTTTVRPVTTTTMASGPLVGVRINSQAELDAALAKATGGEVFLLSGSFGGKISSKSYSKPVILSSYDLKNRAKFNWTKFTSINNLTMKSLDFNYQAKVDSEFFMQFLASSNIVLDDIHAYGSLNDDALDDGVCLNVDGTNNITVSNSEFEQCHKGMVFGNSTNIKVINNHIHNMRADGMQFSNVQNVVIDKNLMEDWDFYNGDHRDCIQFLQVKGGKASSDVSITNNACLQNKGTSMQGIFIADEQDFPNIRFNIENNVVAQTFMPNGIMITRGQSTRIVNNTIIYATDYDYSKSGNPIGFRIDSSGLTFSGNVGLNGNVSAAQAGINANLQKISGQFTNLKPSDLVVPNVGYQNPK